MPEKIRAAVTSKEITPEEHNIKKAHGQTRPGSAISKDPVSSAAAEQASHSYTNGMAVLDNLDEEALKEITSEGDLKMFKDAWAKAIKANEEVRCCFFCCNIVIACRMERAVGLESSLVPSSALI